MTSALTIYIIRPHKLAHLLASFARPRALLSRFYTAMAMVLFIYIYGREHNICFPRIALFALRARVDPYLYTALILSGASLVSDATRARVSRKCERARASSDLSAYLRRIDCYFLTHARASSVRRSINRGVGSSARACNAQ